MVTTQHCNHSYCSHDVNLFALIKLCGWTITYVQAVVPGRKVTPRFMLVRIYKQPT